MAFNWLKERLWPGHPKGFPSPFRTCPDWIPHAFFKQTYPCRVFFCLSYISACIILFYGVATNRIFVVRIVCYLPIMLYILLWSIARRKLKSRFEMRLEKYNNKICIYCGYPLEGLPDEHQCPECGQQYNIERVVYQWSEWVKYDKIPRFLNSN